MDGYTENRMQENILDLLDPFRVNKEYASMNFKNLKEELDNKTNSLSDITHEDYFKIYSLPISGINKSDEISLIKYHLEKENIETKHLRDLLKAKEDELILRELELERREKKRGSKSPLLRENEHETNENLQKGRLSGSPSSYQSYSYRTRINTHVDSEEKNTLKSENIGSSSPIISELYNSNLTDEEALILAIKESESIANEIIDAPFREKECTTISQQEQKTKITAESLKAEGKSPYYMLENRPEGATDEILDNLYELLINKKFAEVKTFLANKELPLNVMQWIRQLQYQGNTLKQMLLTKPPYIHRCLRPYEE